ncbi:MAG TPA: type I-U CRISPR-associated RAMP protein Csb1/Cas7u [Streptosporangiaceae bacterium]|nr:type I-U CRISPR-associated RAMP protein Csb1/Cas7u [Streptosporangiaceae bacterium]
MSSKFAERLAVAVGEDSKDAGIAVEAVYRPGGGKVMPPSFPEGPYLLEPRWVDGEERRVVVLDQVPSQANRVEEALLAARDEGRIELPLFELRAATSRGPLRLTSLQFPHRYADAYLRDSTVDGERFDRSAPGRRLRQASMEDARPLYERDPGSLVFGAWDSHRQGRWPKFARVYASSIAGLDPKEGKRRGGRMDPSNLSGGIDDKANAEGDWAYEPGGARDFPREKRLSVIGHGNIAPSEVHGGVTISEARRSGWLSLAGLGRLRFGDAPPEAARLARACLAALALAGDRLAFGRPSVWLRSGCDLVRVSEELAFEQDGGGREPWDLTAADAIAAFHELRDKAAAAGVIMSADTIVLEPIRSLAQAIEYSLTKAAGEE